MRPIQLGKGRRGDKTSPLRPEEFTALRLLVYKRNWAGREVRPEACATASIVASRLRRAAVQDVAT
eukprot:1987276-Lingulodinium_polyedra.AAC.1